tara:strand:+ start:6936 stop:7439 length:504 start_codon:yes stop_codon:yes gene_type:complete
MRVFKHTNITLREVGDMLRVKLQDELKFQKHNATGRLSRGLKYNVVKRGISILNVTSSVAYWKAVNNPAFAKTPNFREVLKWVQAKGLALSSAEPIFKKLRGFYGKPYVYWTEGNNLRRTNFAGYVANKFKGEVASKLAPSIGVDVANMIAKQIKKNNPKTNVAKAF